MTLSSIWLSHCSAPPTGHASPECLPRARHCFRVAVTRPFVLIDATQLENAAAGDAAAGDTAAGDAAAGDAAAGDAAAEQPQSRLRSTEQRPSVGPRAMRASAQLAIGALGGGAAAVVVGLLVRPRRAQRRRSSRW